ncbi:MAG: hypothetical protein K0R73_1390, partial [Candidatus Midichloriaceae bacterium]|nr:hypothetical protein [Candidatus Midichloriaceae bacterium]
FFVLCFLLVKFINLLDMDGLSVVTLTALSTVMAATPSGVAILYRSFIPFYTALAIFICNTVFLLVKNNYAS